MQFPRKTGWFAPAVLLAAVATLPARAVEPDKFIPSDSEAILVVNVRQMLDSPLVKKYGLEHLREALKSNKEARTFFEAAALDPFKDIDSVLVGGSANGGKDPKFVAVVRGTFNLSKIESALAAEAKSKPDELKIKEKGDLKIYELKSKDSEKPVFAAFADGSTLVISPSADETAAAAKGKAGKVNATLITALGRIGGKESLYLAALVTDEMRKQMSANPKMKELAPRLQFLTGTFNLTNEFKLKLTVQTADEKAASEVKGFVGQFMPLLGLMAAGNEKVGPLVGEIIKKIEVKTGDNAVVISLAVSEEEMKKIGESANGADKDKKDKQ